jgi:two-component system, cell cycle sensor histidine kinase and response regulator CckA
VARLILTQHGYRVLEAATPAGASDTFLRHASQIDLLIADVSMPEINGPALARRLVALRPQPGLRVLLISEDDPEAVPAAATEPIKMLTKPFRSSELLRAVRDVLAAPNHHDHVA